MTPVFAADIDASGRLKLLRRDLLERHLAGLIGQRVEVLVRLPKNKRSERQNRYYWGVVVQMLSEFTGHTPDEIHDHLKWRFLRVAADAANNRPLVTVRSTAALATAEFEKFLEDVRMWAGQALSVHIPLPNEVDGWDEA
jgi:hypothetical protein